MQRASRRASWIVPAALAVAVSAAGSAWAAQPVLPAETQMQVIPAVTAEDLDATALPHGTLKIPAPSDPMAVDGYIPRLSDGTWGALPRRTANESLPQLLQRTKDKRVGDVVYLSGHSGSLLVIGGVGRDLGVGYLSTFSNQDVQLPKTPADKVPGMASDGALTDIDAGHVYLIKTVDGPYALLRVVDKSSSNVTVQWVLQPNGSTRFLLPQFRHMFVADLQPTVPQAPPVAVATQPAAGGDDAPVARMSTTGAMEVIPPAPAGTPALTPAPAEAPPAAALPSIPNTAAISSNAAPPDPAPATAAPTIAAAPAAPAGTLQRPAATPQATGTPTPDMPAPGTLSPNAGASVAPAGGAAQPRIGAKPPVEWTAPLRDPSSFLPIGDHPYTSAAFGKLAQPTQFALDQTMQPTFPTFELHRLKLTLMRMALVETPVATEDQAAQKAEAIRELGQLKASEAVPLLISQISFMDPAARSRRQFSIDSFHPAVAALKQIGQSAADAALQALEEMPQEASDASTDTTGTKAPNEAALLKSPAYRARLLSLVLLGVDGHDVAQFRLQHALHAVEAGHRGWINEALKYIEQPQ